MPLVRVVFYVLEGVALFVALVCWAFPPEEGEPPAKKVEQPEFWLMWAVLFHTLGSF